MNAPMPSCSFITDLQRQQLAHDMKSHWDILCLPAQDRLKHMVLHFAKYAGRLARIDAGSFNQTIIDTFIIALATANALNLDLGRKCKTPATSRTPTRDPAREFFMALCTETGRMAKACEALDHVERFASREELEAGVVAICNQCLEVATANNIQLTQAVLDRWREIDSKNAV